MPGGLDRGGGKQHTTQPGRLCQETRVFLTQCNLPACVVCSFTPPGLLPLLPPWPAPGLPLPLPLVPPQQELGMVRIKQAEVGWLLGTMTCHLVHAHYHLQSVVAVHLHGRGGQGGGAGWGSPT